MIAHVVLLSPQPNLTPDQMERLVASLERAAHDIPSVRKVQVGRRLRLGHGYEDLGTTHFGYCAIFEFDDVEGLEAYLRHPAHQELGARFYDSLAAGLACDYEMGEPSRAREWLRSP